MRNLKKLCLATLLALCLLPKAVQAFALYPDYHNLRFAATNAANERVLQNAYDPAGNLTNRLDGAGNTITYRYDELDRLISRSAQSAPSADNFSYDALGNRLVAGSVVWIPDHADPLKRPLIEADAITGEPIRYYLWAPSRLLGFIDAVSGTLTVAHCDEYGSVIALTDVYGNTLHTAHYGPNGQDWGTTGHNPTPFAWLGGHGVQQVSTSEHIGPLYLTRYRLYAASLNRFLSSDPHGLAGGLNLYAYALGDPLSYIDPLGLKADGMWYDQTSDWLRNITETAKDYYSDTLPWGAAGAINTAIDIVTGAGHAPAAIGHLGEGTGQFAADPSWRNAGGVVSDALTVGAVFSATAAALPSLNGSAAAAATPSQGQKVYRVYGENNKPMGESWTPVDPGTVKNFRSSAGLPDSNTGRFVIEGTIKDASGIAVRKALPLDGNPGGLTEYVIPKTAYSRNQMWYSIEILFP